MKKMLLSALVAGSLVVPMTNAEAYHVIAAHKEKIAAEVQAEIEARSKQNGNKVAIQQEPNIHKRVEMRSGETMAEEKAINRKAVVKLEPIQSEVSGKGLSATATARTDRSLLSKETPEDIVKGIHRIIARPVLEEGIYTMRGNETLNINVFGHGDLSLTQKVQPDGNLAYPLIGSVEVKGKTVAQLTQELTDRLSEYVIDPKVNIVVASAGTTSVHVYGAVSSQGQKELTAENHRLMDALGAAGIGQKTAKRKILLIPANGEEPREINVQKYMKTGNLEYNPLLNQGDFIYVASNHKLGYQAILSQIFSFAALRNTIRDND